ncbi:hypothetical protein Droror1_Dr00019951, partial [Drosera rotundifolia]
MAVVGSGSDRREGGCGGGNKGEERWRESWWRRLAKTVATGGDGVAEVVGRLKTEGKEREEGGVDSAKLSILLLLLLLSGPVPASVAVPIAAAATFTRWVSISREDDDDDVEEIDDERSEKGVVVVEEDDEEEKEGSFF